MWLFYHFNFERNYDVKVKESMDFVKYMNFDKNETESKMEIATRSFRETCVSAHVKIAN